MSSKHSNQQRNRRALLALAGIVIASWFGRSLWFDNYVEYSESRPAPRRESRPQQPRRVQSRQPRSQMPPIADLKSVAFDSDAVQVSLTRHQPEVAGLVVTELHYHPESDRGEFLELTHLGDGSLSLAGWRFTKGINYEFPQGSVLASGDSLILCRDPAEWMNNDDWAGAIPKEYEGGLRNSGERLVLRDADGQIRIDVTFADESPWPASADGQGHSLQYIGSGDTADPASWIAAVPNPGRFLPSLGENEADVGLYALKRAPKRPQEGETVTLTGVIRDPSQWTRLNLHVQVGELESRHSLLQEPAEGVMAAEAFEIRLPEVAAGTVVRYRFVGETVAGDLRQWPESGALPDQFAYVVRDASEDSAIPVYELRVATAPFQRIHVRRRDNVTIDATFIADGRVYDDVRVRIRGAYARSWPKKSYKIFFNKEHLFEERSRLNLNSAWRDPAYVREILAYEIYRLSGAPAQRAGLVELRVNGEFWGLYVDVEQPDKRLLERIGLKGASLYKADSDRRQSDERRFSNPGEYRRHYRKETKEELPFEDLVEFCQLLTHREGRARVFQDPKVNARFEAYLCATAITQNWDGYNKNHFVGFETADPSRWFLLPWDLDRTLGDSWHWQFDETEHSPLMGTQAVPGVTGWNRVFEVVLSDPQRRRAYFEKLGALLETPFSEDWIRGTCAELGGQLVGLADRDRERWGGDADWESAVEQLERNLIKRRRFLLAFLAENGISVP